MKQILTKLHAIMSEVDHIKKDKRNTHQSYDYASEKIIKETMQKKFVEHKVWMKFETANCRIESGITIIDCLYTFYDIESGESINGTFQGTGQSRDDKGNYAAVTGAIKYILTSNFLIPTGDDPENDVKKPASDTTPPVEPLASPFQKKVIKEALSKLHPNPIDCANALATILAAYKAESLDKLQIRQATAVKNSLEKRVKEMRTS